MTPDVQYIADQVAAKFIANWTDAAGLFSSATHVSALKTYLLDTSGHTTAEGVHAFAGTDLQGSGSSGVMPPEVAVCLSEYSYPPGGFTTHKGRKRGRMYLPYISQSAMDSNGKVSSSAAGLAVTGWQEIFNAVNTVESASGRTDPMGLVVLSTVGGATYEVLHLAIDDHFDSQRRRQHQSPSTLHTSDLTPW
jgi:hypothetical protein